ncbi:hypothetical protein LCGC14_1453470 [marine sediment metagenome]|uniref:Uncharacterized protein n=1 Tax=marine sediment metagenome TaxID=412755 RepID=A0A0F9K3F1_9ZZZZ
MGYNMSALEAHEHARLGIRVFRATDNITTGEDLFTVSKGNCLVTLMLGEITTDIENKTVNFTLVANPTTGTATDVAALLDIDDDPEGTIYTVHGAAGTALQRGESGSSIGPNVPFVVSPGVIEATVGATHTGSIKWTLWYVPLETGALITAA